MLNGIQHTLHISPFFFPKIIFPKAGRRASIVYKDVSPV